MPKELILVDTKQIKALTMNLKGIEVEATNACYHALKRTMSFFQAETARVVTENYAVKKSEVRASLKANNPTKNRLEAGFTSTGYTFSMAHFPHTPSVQRGGRYKVKVAIKKGKKSVFKGLHEASPYVGRTGAKSEDKTQFNVFQRTGVFAIMKKGRYEGLRREEIIVPRTLSIPQMISNDNLSERIMKASAETYDKRFEHELNRALEKVRKEVEK